VSLSAIGTPAESTRARIPVIGPPRERTRHGIDHLLWAVGGMLMHVGTNRPAGIAGIKSNRSPSLEAVDAGRARTVALENVYPRRAGPRPPEVAVRNPAFVEPRRPCAACSATAADHRPFESVRSKRAISSPPDRAGEAAIRAARDGSMGLQATRESALTSAPELAFHRRFADP
jgi:hypothetical protein